MSKASGVMRAPILINEHAVALISLFIKPHDSLDDCWSFDAVNEWYYTRKDSAAKQFVEQLEDQWSPRFMMELRDEITRKLAEHDKTCGTKFATTTAVME